MATIAFVSPHGGVGQTTLIANLATLLAQRREPCLVVDLCPQNTMGLHLGLETSPSQGWASSVLTDHWWAQNALINSLHVCCLPHGDLDANNVLHLEQRLMASPNWLTSQLSGLEFSDAGYVLLDAPMWPSALAFQSVLASDLVVVCLTASAKSCAAFPAIQAMVASHQESTAFAVMLTSFDPRSKSQILAMQTLQAQWNDLLIPYTLHHDENMATAFQENNCASALFPQAQSVHDVQGVANWLTERFNLQSAAE